MSSLLQVQKLSKSFGSRVLLDKVSFHINEGEHIGVIGPNGAGKTTLFKMICGLEELDEGEVVQRRGLRIGYLKQHDEWSLEQSAESFLEEGTTLPIWEIKSLGTGLGLSEEQFQSPIKALSGGFRMRLKLLHLLGEEPDILMLDEPTNYLDLESILVLEKFLQGYNKTFLLISHDREFLRRCTDNTLEVEGQDVTKYPGSLDDYFEQKAMLREQLEARAMNQEQKRKEVMDFVNRFRAKATKARQAQSRLKSLQKMEKIEVKPLQSTAAIQIPPPAHCGKEVIRVSGLQLGYGEKLVLSGLDFSIHRGDHIGIVGVNGIGKSTLLKGLVGRLKPQAGELHLGHEVKMAYYGQHVGDELDLNLTVIEAMMAQAHSDVLPQEVKNLAGSLLFSGDDMEKKLTKLSGGERARVALGQVLLRRAPVILLDEPTNHLDFETVEALTQALNVFKGTVLVVSHDRSFVSRVSKKIFELKDGSVDVYPGSYDDYVWSIQQGGWGTTQDSGASSKGSSVSEAPPSSESPASSEATPSRSTLSFDERKEEKRRLRRFERKIEESERQMAKMQFELEKLNAELVSRPDEAQKISIDLAYLQNDLQDLEAQWLECIEKKEEIEKLLSGT